MISNSSEKEGESVMIAICKIVQIWILEEQQLRFEKHSTAPPHSQPQLEPINNKRRKMKINISHVGGFPHYHTRVSVLPSRSLHVSFFVA